MSIFKNVGKKAMPEFRIFHMLGNSFGRSEQWHWGSSAQRATSGISGDIYDIYKYQKSWYLWLVEGQAGGWSHLLNILQFYAAKSGAINTNGWKSWCKVLDWNCKLISIAGTCSSNLHDWNINLWGYNSPWKGGEGSRECFHKYQDWYWCKHCPKAWVGRKMDRL